MTRWIAMTVACVVAAGCAPRLVPRGVPLYVVGVENATGRDLDDVGVTYGHGDAFPEGWTLMFGRLPAGARAGDGFVPLPIPDRARVTWRVVADSSRGRGDVDVLDRAGATFSGYVTFVIRSDGGVELRLEPRHLGSEE